MDFNTITQDQFNLNWLSVTTFLNSWVNFGGVYRPAQYTKDPMGFVHVRGIVKSGSVGTFIFQLPVGFRPLRYTEAFASMASTGGTANLCRLEVDLNGNVYHAFGGVDYVLLNPITFDTRP